MQICTRCKKTKEDEEFSPEKRKLNGLRSQCKSCRSQAENYRLRMDPMYRESQNQKTKDRRRQQRIDLLNKFQHLCDCCGENRLEFLAIDHIDGGGTAHGRDVGPWGIYKDVMASAPTRRYRVLCHNCNMARGIYDYCPHEKERAEDEQKAPTSTNLCL